MAIDTTDDVLTDRAQRLLKVLIESYIRDGQPVGSRTLSRESGLNLSSATIRNVMADLEQLGFVTSPHTSAGRIPTDKGYRLFVDSLLKLKPLDGSQILLNSPQHAQDPVREQQVQTTVIELKDAQGRPIPNQPYRIVLGDGRERTGVLDEQGRAEIELDGDGEVFFPGVAELQRQ